MENHSVTSLVGKKGSDDFGGRGTIDPVPHIHVHAGVRHLFSLVCETIWSIELVKFSDNIQIGWHNHTLNKITEHLTTGHIHYMSALSAIQLTKKSNEHVINHVYWKVLYSDSQVLICQIMCLIFESASYPTWPYEVKTFQYMPNNIIYYAA